MRGEFRRLRHLGHVLLVLWEDSRRDVHSIGASNSAITVRRRPRHDGQAGASTAPRAASVGDGQCDAANNVSPCYDGGDCCEMTCIDGDTHTCGSYDCKDPDAPPVPDPYYPDAAWYLEAIRAPEAWAAGYDGSGVQILINDQGVDNTHPDLAKLDLANSCGVYARARK